MDGVDPVQNHACCDHGEDYSPSALALGIAVLEPLALEVVSREPHRETVLHLLLGLLDVLEGVHRHGLLVLLFVIGAVGIHVWKREFLLCALLGLPVRQLAGFPLHLGSDPRQLHDDSDKNHEEAKPHVQRAVRVLLEALEPAWDRLIPPRVVVADPVLTSP